MSDIDYDLVLKHYPPAEDFKSIGAIIMTRYMIRYPEYHLMFPLCRGIPTGRLLDHPNTARVGVHKLTQIRELVAARGKHQSLAKPLAIVHITRCKAPINCYRRLVYILCEVFAEMCGMDPVGQHDLRRATQRVWDDFENTYREMGIPA